jgi:squalene-hopene/tetraprenyl-beta-curcumene cyclase
VQVRAVRLGEKTTVDEALLKGSRRTLNEGAGSTRLGAAIEAAQRHLLARQSIEGYWGAELNGDATLESDAVMLMHYLGDVDASRQERLLRYVLSQQNEDGGWPIFKHGPSDPNATVKAYFALRLGGRSDAEPSLEKARLRILQFGGIEVCNSYTKFYLAIFGQYDWKRLPSMLPEIMLLPRSPKLLNLYRISAWTRTIVVPMLIIYALKPYVSIPFSLKDLILPYSPPGAKSLRNAFWRAFFKFADRAMSLYDRLGVRWIRRIAIKRCLTWMLERMKPPGGLGAIYPPMLNSIVALRALGFSKTCPAIRKALAEFNALAIEEGDVIRWQPCFSAVWDSAWAVHALGRTGLASHPATQRGADWLLSKQVFTGGDWQVNNPAGKPGAWAFEFDNPVYPDTDDTCAVLMGLFWAGRRNSPGFDAGLDWLRTMQNPDGGWGAFDRNVNLEILEHIPWADHNAMLDPSTADLTGRILEAFACAGVRLEQPFVAKAIAFLRRTQEADGTWFGRWGVNYLYGTWQVLVGLKAVGVDMREGWIQRAADWLRAVQNPDGGWGESCRSYNEPALKGKGPSTPSQTAWAVLGLLAAGAAPSDPPIARGIEWILSRQRADGTWDESEHTGTGFPAVFYLVYTMYRHYFPLLALQAAAEAEGRSRPVSDRFEWAVQSSGRRN